MKYKHDKNIIFIDTNYFLTYQGLDVYTNLMCWSQKQNLAIIWPFIVVSVLRKVVPNLRSCYIFAFLLWRARSETIDRQWFCFDTLWIPFSSYSLTTSRRRYRLGLSRSGLFCHPLPKQSWYFLLIRTTEAFRPRLLLQSEVKLADWNSSILATLSLQNNSVQLSTSVRLFT